MIWDSLKGHTDQIEMFRRAISRGRLSHAFLFCGPNGIGKKRFARLLAQCLFCTSFPDTELDACGECPSCRQMQAGTHPDFLFLECPEGKNVFPIDLIAGHRDNRGREGLCYELSLKPTDSPRKIAVLDHADLMNQESANAFLKTLEEPPGYATIILLAGSRDSLLPTIQSRCQAVRFSPLSESMLSELLLEQQLVENSTEAASLAEMCEGSMQVAKQLSNSEFHELRRLIEQSLSKGDFHGTQVADEVVSALESLGDTNAQRRGADWIAHYCIEFYRRALRKIGDEGDTSNESTFFAAERVGMLIERSAETLKQIERSAPVSLSLHGLFSDLLRIERRLPTG